MKKNLLFLLAFGLVFSSLAGCAPQARQADTKASVSVQAIESGDSSRESLSNNAKTSAPETAEASVPENAEISDPGTGRGVVSPEDRCTHSTAGPSRSPYDVHQCAG